MRSILIFTYVILYFALSTGVLFSVHKCGNQIVNVSLFSSKAKSCCAKGCEKKGCCENETHFFKVKEDQKLYADFHIPDFHSEFLAEFDFSELLFENTQSILFYEYLRVYKEVNSKYFIFENVLLKGQFKKYEKLISNYLEVEPLILNSSLLSSQNRERTYWTNFPNISVPKDRKIYTFDVIPNSISCGVRGVMNKDEGKYIRKLTFRKDNKFNCLVTKPNSTNLVKVGNEDIRKITIEEYNTQVALLNDRMALIQSKTVTITVRTSLDDQLGLWGQGRNAYIGLADSNQATGGLGGGRTLVGEFGPEVVDLPPGSRVHNATNSAQMGTGGSGLTDRDLRKLSRYIAEEVSRNSR